jgi:glycosyltransferase involved in cell wall biosynthesis
LKEEWSVTMNQNPLVSIGLPVYNGENYLPEAIDSILAQTFTNFELIICDNASIDSTQTICETAAARDPRIKYYRSEVNLGAARNFNRTFELATGKYFKWMAHDDVLAHEFLEKCVNVLEQDPRVVLSFSLMRMIGPNSEFIMEYADTDLNKTNSSNPVKRFQELIRLSHACYEVFGLVRAEILRQTQLIDSYIGSDRALLAELSLMGRYHTVSKHLFFPREHPKRSINLKRHERAAWFDIFKSGKISLPRWQIYSNYFEIVRNSPLTLFQKAKCLFHLIVWLVPHRKEMVKDLIQATTALFAKYRFSNNFSFVQKFYNYFIK